MKKNIKKVLKDVKSFTIDRKKWRRGNDNSCLVNNAGNYCCLGFYAEACGFDTKTIRNLSDPRTLNYMLAGFKVSNIYLQRVKRSSNIEKWDTKLLGHSGMTNSNICQELMIVNDMSNFFEKDDFEDKREKKITALFKKIGVKVKFIG